MAVNVDFHGCRATYEPRAIALFDGCPADISSSTSVWSRRQMKNDRRGVPRTLGADRSSKFRRKVTSAREHGFAWRPE